MNSEFVASRTDDIASKLLDDEDVWITRPYFTKSNPLHVQLRELEHTFRCRICQDFFRSPVSVVPCMHTYCSECIRQHFKTGLKSMKRQASCPECRVVVETKGAIEFCKCLVPNRSIEMASMKFQQLRANLHLALGQLTLCKTSPRKPINRNEDICNRNSKDDEITKDEFQRERSIKSQQCHTSLEKRVPRSLDGVKDPSTESNKLYGGNHQDKPIRAKRKVTFYKSLKKKQLQELCAVEGLPVHGTEQDLIRRHESFVTLYNAECDSFYNPKPHHVIVAEIIKREEARHEVQLYAVEKYNNETAVDCMERLKQTQKELGNINASDQQKQSGKKLLTSGNTSFDEKLQLNFAKLIAQGKERMKASRETSLGTDCLETDAESERPSETGAKSENEHLSTIHETNSVHFKSLNSPTSLEHDRTNGVVGERTVPTSCVGTGTSTSALMASFSGADGAINEKTLSSTANTSGSVLTREGCKRPRVFLQSKRQSNSSLATNTCSGFENHRKIDNVACSHIASKANIDNIIEPALIGPWECPACTYFNQKNRSSKASCEICDTPRPKRKFSPTFTVRKVDC